jgi:hypothetical protein
MQIKLKLWKPKRRKEKYIHQPRERRPRFGELVQIDGILASYVLKFLSILPQESLGQGANFSAISVPRRFWHCLVTL